MSAGQGGGRGSGSWSPCISIQELVAWELELSEHIKIGLEILRGRVFQQGFEPHASVHSLLQTRVHAPSPSASQPLSFQEDVWEECLVPQEPVLSIGGDAENKGCVAAMLHPLRVRAGFLAARRLQSVVWRREEARLAQCLLSSSTRAGSHLCGHPPWQGMESSPPELGWVAGTRGCGS